MNDVNLLKAKAILREHDESSMFHERTKIDDSIIYHLDLIRELETSPHSNSESWYESGFCRYLDWINQ